MCSLATGASHIYMCWRVRLNCCMETLMPPSIAPISFSKLARPVKLKIWAESCGSFDPVNSQLHTFAYFTYCMIGILWLQCSIQCHIIRLPICTEKWTILNGQLLMHSFPANTIQIASKKNCCCCSQALLTKQPVTYPCWCLVINVLWAGQTLHDGSSLGRHVAKV